MRQAFKFSAFSHHPKKRYRSWRQYEYMKIKCPKCEKIAELGDDFSYVKCSHCSLDMSYGEYVKFIAYKDARYSDILGDYVSDTKGTTSGTLDEW